MSISPVDALNEFKNNDINFFAGVPDSLLKHFCSYVDENLENENHVIAANEGSAVAISIGYHLATNKIPIVYMQNSGLGNAINPLLSLADEKVYSIPMVLLIGWRGEPGVSDEPQHIKQGAVTEPMLNAMDIETFVLDKDSSTDIIKNACSLAKTNKKPVAILVKKNTFSDHTPRNSSSKISSSMQREDIIHVLATKAYDSEHFVVSTTGVASRELYEFRVEKNMGHSHDFLTVGGMGHASQIGLGLAMFNQNKILCLDGDGAFLMHAGSAAEIGVRALKNFKHIVINNGCHDSVGGQPTRANQINLNQIASSYGYKVFPSCNNIDQLTSSIDEFLASDECCFMEIKATPGFRKNLGRPKTTPKENKLCFMESLQK